MIALALLGSILVLVGTIWIVVIAFQNNDIIWGIVSIFCGIATLIYAIQHFEQAKIPLGLWAVGLVLSIIGRVAVQAN